jgi:hypothetical protein
MAEKLICVICKEPLTAENCINAAPLAEGRCWCCNYCNNKVIEERLRRTEQRR